MKQGGSIREGFLMKQGGRVKSWKKRYFVLSNTLLCYYRSKDDFDSLLCVIPIDYNWSIERLNLPKFPYSLELKSEKAITKDKKNIFIKESVDERVFIFSCGNESEREVWITDIQNVINASTNNPTKEKNNTPEKHIQGIFLTRADSYEEELKRERRLPSSPTVILQRPSGSGQADLVLLEESKPKNKNTDVS
eukprot:c8239_g1_i1.p1 GENE.c8239_g1_i1~~c8239_g1_i1.p1  ORF type:complete len:193 (-),score=65.91 c8239_g1_i1:33-611(-)